MALRPLLPGHRRRLQGKLIADSALFPTFVQDRGLPFPWDLTAQEMTLRAMPLLRPCVVSQNIELLNCCEVYRQSILIMKRRNGPGTDVPEMCCSLG